MMWYEDTPTVWSHNGRIDYINFAYEAIEKQYSKDANVKEWVDKARAEKTIVTLVTRAAVPEMLKDVDAKAITDAKIAASTLDVAPPSTGTAAEKETAVAAKLATVIPVAEYEKVAKLQADAAEVIAAIEEPELGDDKPIGKVVSK